PLALALIGPSSASGLIVRLSIVSWLACMTSTLWLVWSRVECMQAGVPTGSRPIWGAPQLTRSGRPSGRRGLLCQFLPTRQLVELPHRAQVLGVDGPAVHQCARHVHRARHPEPAGAGAPRS